MSTTASTLPQPPLPFAYPWTGHAQKLYEALTATGCRDLRIAKATPETFYKYLTWRWVAYKDGQAEPVLWVNIDDRGYFSSLICGGVRVVAGAAYYGRLSKREALDAAVSLIYQCDLFG